MLDLLRPTSTRPLRRLCAHFGVDPSAPSGVWHPPPSVKLRLAVGAFAAFLVGAILLGALTRR